MLRFARWMNGQRMKIRRNSRLPEKVELILLSSQNWPRFERGSTTQVEVSCHTFEGIEASTIYNIAMLEKSRVACRSPLLTYSYDSSRSYIILTEKIGLIAILKQLIPQKSPSAPPRTLGNNDRMIDAAHYTTEVLSVTTMETLKENHLAPKKEDRSVQRKEDHLV